MEVGEDDVAEILYTSGTTGVPKGTMLTQGNLFFHADAIIQVLELNDDDRALMVVPMFHGYGITVMLCCFRVGTCFVLLDPFDAEEVFGVVEKYKVTFLPMVVAMYFMVYHHPEREKYDLSSLRIGISGASAMPAQLMQDASAALEHHHPGGVGPHRMLRLRHHPAHEHALQGRAASASPTPGSRWG